MTIVPRSWARASASGSGSMPLDVTIAAQPSSIACSCASARSPTTTMSPASMLRPIVATSMEMTQRRPVIIVSPSPVMSSPWSTSTIVATCAGASANVGTPRDSRTYRRARSRSVTIPVSLPSSSTTGMRSMPCSAISRPTCRTGSERLATTSSSFMTSDTRSRMWGRNSGCFAPLRSSAHAVCRLTSPRRTGVYVSSGCSRPMSSARPIAEPIESRSGLRCPVT